MRKVSYNEVPALRILLFLLSIVVVLSSLWAVLAFWYQAPGKSIGRYLLIIGWVLAAVLVLVLLWRGLARPDLARPDLAWQSMLVYALMFILLRIWWASLEPSNERNWSDDLARTTHGVVQGEQVTLHNVRNFTWRSETDYDIAWETREYDLSRLRSVDMTTSYWDSPAIAHVLLSFGFDDGQFVVFSVEIRKERHEAFSELGGFFKKFELSVVATDERDAIRVRTNVRDEDAYLYRTRLDQDAARQLFLAFIAEANELAAEPRFYHTVTANCTTLVFSMMRRIIGKLPLDHRLLLSGHLPAYVQKQRGLQLGYSLEELRAQGRITDRAIAADQAADFSQQIRQGVPGWEAETLPLGRAPTE
ncbi:DUF4105 domain-containing protein [Halopseudomonas pelagia]|uniref:Lnb N-terminal periplasmic domain-containing protein n=1 Tax=Halopseudomonas pelagia TaxID=553151 RepID=UPI00278C12A7|nr:DUF4105 domain-containing protein [Halopseudomonas pelagia]